ncbi:MAG: hypothetical protein Q8R53_02490 [Nanoarchaeota archaeon]|nr:hypothetical protein [Nanoarchaeota archaeon]
MEIAYLMAGKRFQARDVADLNDQLAPYNLISNLDRDGLGDLSARRLTEARNTSRYDMTQSVGDPADSQGYDVIVGKIIYINGYGQPDVVEIELSELEIILKEVREDIPDAKLIAGSYWS